jgi:hypothetical protein
MPDKKSVQPDKLSIVDYKLLKGQIDTPDSFDQEKIDGFYTDNSLQLGFNLDDKLAKAVIVIQIRSNSECKNEKEATGNFEFVYIFSIANLEELASKEESTDKLLIDPHLANTLASISYSTSRGILLTRLQGTVFENFILPVIDTSVLLKTT